VQVGKKKGRSNREPVKNPKCPKPIKGGKVTKGLNSSATSSCAAGGSKSPTTSHQERAGKGIKTKGRIEKKSNPSGPTNQKSTNLYDADQQVRTKAQGRNKNRTGWTIGSKLRRLVGGHWTPAAPPNKKKKGKKRKNVKRR